MRYAIAIAPLMVFLSFSILPMQEYAEQPALQIEALQEELFKAVRMDDYMKVVLCLDKGADINARDIHGDTALLAATRSGQEIMVAVLLSKGANIHATDKFGYTSLLWAVRNNHKSIVALLLERGANIDDKDAFVLLAVKLRHYEILKLLYTCFGMQCILEEAKDQLILEDLKKKQTSYFYYLPQELIGELENYIPRAQLKRKIEHLVREYACNQDLSSVLRVLKAWAEQLEYAQFFAELKFTDDILFTLAKRFNTAPEIIAARFLTKGTEDWLIMLYPSYKALVRAAKKGNLEEVKKLIEAGLNVDMPISNYRPLIHAGNRDQVNVMLYLVEKGADISELILSRSDIVYRFE